MIEPTWANVASAARALLIEQATDKEWSTTELATRLMPSAFSVIHSKVVYSLLSKLASYELADCCQRGVARRGQGPMRNKIVRPWIWHAPTQRHAEALPIRAVCPTCQRLLPS